MNAGLRQLLSKLQPFKIDFGQVDYDGVTNARPVEDLNEANGISSWVKGTEGKRSLLDLIAEQPISTRGKHIVAIDIDHPVYVVESSTPGHHHLYIDVEMEWKVYEKLISALTEAGVIEPGYEAATRYRGYSALRLPWVKKELPKVEQPHVGTEDLRF